MNVTAVVSGAAGFVGSHLVDYLLREGYSVIGLDNLRTGRKENLAEATKHGNFRFEQLDICSQGLSRAVKKPVDVIFHLAAISSVKFSIENPSEVNRVNVSGTLNMLELARQRDAEKFVYSSSAAVYGNPDTLPVSEETPLVPLSPYAASKIAAEMYCASYGSLYSITPTIFRYFNVFGPRQENSEYSGVIPIFINQGLQNKEITVDGDGSQTRSFIYVEDIAKATYLGSQLESESEHILNLSGSDSISILELARMVKELVPDSSSTIVHRSAREGDVKDSIGSMERTSDVLGFSPTVPFKTGLDRTVSWYRLHQD
ncbi:MAG: NAD-dependent epimerase/dehydratase family protein [Candidatus Thorarchaeota archaeon]|jgi:UDP-glucose 4-epimerase